MDKMYLVKNVSEEEQSIVAIGLFAAGEVREVSENNLKRLLRNPNFVEVKAKEEKESKEERVKKK